MARLPTPVPPPVRHVERAELAELDDLDDEASLAKTVDRKSVRITTARFTSVAPCAIDVVPASSSFSASSLPAALLQHPRGALAAALWLACVIAGIGGVLLGHAHHARPSHAHATAAALATPTAPAPRAAVIVEANEEITQRPILAPGKVVESSFDSPVAVAVADAIPAPARPLRRQGFGHLGADRVASGAAARRAAPHRR
jgi:hypothetical protein